MKTKLFMVGGALLFGAIYGIAGITSIEPGEVGIVVKQFGDNKGMQPEPLGTGMHWKDPVQYDVPVYDARFKQYTDFAGVESTTNDGQPITVDVSLEIGLDPVGVSNLHETVGRNWYASIVYPLARKAIREATSGQSSNNIYRAEGRRQVSAYIDDQLSILQERGVIASSNVRSIRFTNARFIDTLERKAAADQEEIIQRRLAKAALEEAQKKKNEAEGAAFAAVEKAKGAKQAAILAAEAEKEKKRLEGEGERLAREEKAKGNFAIYKAEADGRKLLVSAYGSSEAVVSVEWAQNLGPNIKVYGVPTGAPGTSSYIFDGALREATDGVDTLKMVNK